MAVRIFATFCLLAISPLLTFGADPIEPMKSEKPASKESITVKVVGTLRTGIVAIGGETTGTTITAKDITWELDFGKKAPLPKVAEKLDGKKVVVRGNLERRKGVEINERWIVHVSDWQAVDDSGVGASGNGDSTTSEKAKERADALRANVKNFCLELTYNGEQDKPFYGLIVSVPTVALYRSKPNHRIMFVKEHEASRIIDHLAREGFLDHAISKMPTPTMPGYTMKVAIGIGEWHQDLGWGLPMIHRLDALRDVLPDASKQEMDLLLGRLSGLRKQWEAEQSPFDANFGREGSRVVAEANGIAMVGDFPLTNCDAEEPVTKTEWRELFNGKDLTGWKANMRPESFMVENGTIKVHGKNGMAHLFYVGDQTPFERFKDFEIEFEARGEPESNSGLFFHTSYELRPGKFRALGYLGKGYEVQLNSTAKEKNKTGSLYAVANLAESPVDETEWFTMRVRVEGQRIRVWLNNKLVNDYTEPADPMRPPDRAGRLIDPQGGAIALQAHDPKSVFYFKSIKVRSL